MDKVKKQSDNEGMQKYRRKIKGDEERYEEMERKDIKEESKKPIKTTKSKMSDCERRALRKQWREKHEDTENLKEKTDVQFDPR